MTSSRSATHVSINLRPRLLLPLLVACTVAVFLLAAGSASAGSGSFPNTTLIKIPGSGDSGPASPYPSPVVVSGMTGPITDVNVTLHRVGHSFPNDIRALLVSPSGEKVRLMSGRCGADDIEDFTWILDQQALEEMPSGPRATASPTGRRAVRAAFRPRRRPRARTPTSLEQLQRRAGQRHLGALRGGPEATDDTGDIEGGWTLTVSTGPVDVELPDAGNFGAASPYPATRTIAGETGVITDLGVVLDGIWHQRPDDLDMLLVGPRGQKVVLMSDACGTFEVAAFGWRWDDEAAGPMPDGDGTNVCAVPNTYKPTDHEPGDVWPAPAPAGPYGSALSDFDLTDPNGEWRLYVNDDSFGATGFFTNRFALGIATRTKAEVAFAEAVAQVEEGATRALTLKRTGPATLGPGTVEVKSLPATASSGEDFTPISSTVSFAANETEKTVDVTALADAADEPDESFVVTIDTPTGDARVGSPASATVTIPAPPAPQGGTGPGAGAGNDAGGQPLTPAAPRCAGKPATIVGTAGRDVLRGTRRADVIVALGGRDSGPGGAWQRHGLRRRRQRPGARPGGARPADRRRGQRPPDRRRRCRPVDRRPRARQVPRRRRPRPLRVWRFVRAVRIRTCRSSTSRPRPKARAHS